MVVLVTVELGIQVSVLTFNLNRIIYYLKPLQTEAVFLFIKLLHLFQIIKNHSSCTIL